MRISTGNFDSILFLGVTPFLNLEIWPKWKILLKQFVSATLLKTLNRINISWNFVVVTDIPCTCAYPQEILINFFLGVTPFFYWDIWQKWKILLKQVVRATPLKLLNRISWNVVVMKDIMCGCAYPQEILIQFFSGRNALFVLTNLTKIKDATQNSSSAHLHWDGSTEFRETL